MTDLRDAPRPLIFVWENLGPMHIDRLLDVAARFPDRKIIGVQFSSKSDVYDWESRLPPSMHVETVFPKKRPRNWLSRAAALGRTLRPFTPGHVFFCHYELPEVLFNAIGQRLRGSYVVHMNDSKFDDYGRTLWRENAKSWYLKPYQAAIGSSRRSNDYMRFLGLPKARTFSQYNSLSIERIRRNAAAPLAPEGTPFADRHFTIVARFIPKKNHRVLLQAYAEYTATSPHPRDLHLCGSGALEGELRQQVADLGLQERVKFRGFLQEGEIAKTLSQTLCLLLPSIEEQFGYVIIEAQALGVPAIVGENCGGRDLLVRNGVTGFVIEHDNPQGLAFFMGLLDRDEALWRRMATAALAVVDRCDSARFADGVEKVLEVARRK